MMDILGTSNTSNYQQTVKQESPYDVTPDQSKSTHHLSKYKVASTTFDSGQQALPNNELPFLSSTG